MEVLCADDLYSIRNQSPAFVVDAVDISDRIVQHRSETRKV